VAGCVFGCFAGGPAGGLVGCFGAGCFGAGCFGVGWVGWLAGLAAGWLVDRVADWPTERPERTGRSVERWASVRPLVGWPFDGVTAGRPVVGRAAGGSGWVIGLAGRAVLRPSVPRGPTGWVVVGCGPPGGTGRLAGGTGGVPGRPGGIRVGTARVTGFEGLTGLDGLVRPLGEPDGAELAFERTERVTGATGLVALVERAGLTGAVGGAGGARPAPGRTGGASVDGVGGIGLSGGFGPPSTRRPTAAPRSLRVIRRTARITSRSPAVPVNHNVMVP
jgi:hypothetical protein